MTIVITTKDANRILGELVEEYGEDYLYDPHNTETGVACRYTWKGEPDCIIGKLMARLGADEKFLEKCDEVGSIQELADQGLIMVANEPLLRGLAGAQQEQDNGETWGTAYARFQREVGLLV